MSQNAPMLALTSNFFGIFLISLSMQFDLESLYIFLKSKNYHQNEIEHIDLLEILGQMIFSLFLAQIINLGRLKKVLLIFLTILLISKFNILFLQEYNLVKIHCLILAGCKYNILIIYLLKSIELLPKANNLAIINFLSALIFGTVIGELIYNSSIDSSLLNYKLLSNLIYLLVFLILMLTTNLPSTNNLFKINFINIIKNIELELLSAFTLGYLFFAMYWEYEIFAITENLKIDAINQVKHHIMISIIAVTLPIQFVIKNSNKYLINIILLATLLLSMLSLEYIGDNYALNLIVIYIIGASSGLLWLSNLSSLSEKFEGENLKTALCFYFGFLSIGGYLGINVTEEVMNKIDQWGFIYSICFVVGPFMLYYLVQTSKKQTKKL